MDRNINSDINPAMLATKTFDRILEMIQKSNLNFVLQVSPFSANISLRKSLIKDRSGTAILPPDLSAYDDNQYLKETIADLVSKNNKLEKDVINLKNELELAVDDCEKANKKVASLEEQISEKDSVEDEVENITLKSEATNFGQKNDSLFSQVAELETEVKGEEIESSVQDDEIIYNVETNNNFKPLACITSYSVDRNEEVFETAKKETEPCEPETVDESNFKEHLKDFLTNYKENANSEPKYSRAVRTNIRRGYNIFHISLLDIGLFNPKLKGFLAEEANEMKFRDEIKLLVMEHGESFGIGKFKYDTSVFFNKKNNKGIEDLWTE